MVKSNYAKAYTEVLEIINHLPKEDYLKIPKERINFYKENMDRNYNFTINPKTDLYKQNISKEANAIIILLYRDYFATKEQVEKIYEILKLNQIKADNDKRIKYNPNNLFKYDKLKEINRTENNKVPVKIKKEKIFTKLRIFIQRIFNKIVK